jgi:hypothetical protein
MPFTKGKSGNPGGRPKAAYNFQGDCRELTPEVLAMLRKEVVKGGRDGVRA